MRMNEEQSKFSEIHQTRLAVRQAPSTATVSRFTSHSKQHTSHDDVTFDAIKTMCDLVSDTLVVLYRLS